MNKFIFILRGIPGSGKTFMAEKLRRMQENLNRTVVVCSADHFFTNPSTGEYVFYAEKVGQAHADCMRLFLAAVRDPNVDTIIVDNCNIDLHAISPYIAIADADGHRYRIVNMKTDYDIAVERQTHAVPDDLVLRNHQKFNEIQFPRQWFENTLQVVTSADPDHRMVADPELGIEISE